MFQNKIFCDVYTHISSLFTQKKHDFDLQDARDQQRLEGFVYKYLDLLNRLLHHFEIPQNHLQNILDLSREQHLICHSNIDLRLDQNIIQAIPLISDLLAMGHFCLALDIKLRLTQLFSQDAHVKGYDLITDDLFLFSKLLLPKTQSLVLGNLSVSWAMVHLTQILSYHLDQKSQERITITYHIEKIDRSKIDFRTFIEPVLYEIQDFDDLQYHLDQLVRFSGQNGSSKHLVLNEVIYDDLLNALTMMLGMIELIDPLDQWAILLDQTQGHQIFLPIQGWEIEEIDRYKKQLFECQKLGAKLYLNPEHWPLDDFHTSFIAPQIIDLCPIQDRDIGRELLARLSAYWDFPMFIVTKSMRR